MVQIKDLSVTKTVAQASDFLVMQTALGETYKITKADLLAGLSSPPATQSNTILTLSDDGTSIIDASGNGYTITNNGVVISTSVSKFVDGSSYIFDSETDLLSVSDNPNFALGADDFTIEAWLLPTALSSQPRYFVSQANNLADNSNRQFSIGIASNKVDWYWTTNGVSDNSLGFSCSPSLNTWQHIAVCRKNGILYGFLDGVLLSSHSHDVSYFNSTADLCIGGFGKYGADGYPQLCFLGNIEKKGLRISKTGLYIETFTPPTTPF